MSMNNIRMATKEDASSVAGIYNYYVSNTVVTFETSTVSDQNMAERITETLDLPLPFLVLETPEKEVVGYAFASKWKGRCAYRYSVEISVYVDPEHGGKGHGTALYTRLFDVLRKDDYHVVIGGISLPNPASIALHEKFGLRKVGEFSEVGRKFDRWINVGYWQGFL